MSVGNLIFRCSSTRPQSESENFSPLDWTSVCAFFAHQQTKRVVRSVSVASGATLLPRDHCGCELNLPPLFLLLYISDVLGFESTNGGQVTRQGLHVLSGGQK